MSEEIKQKTLKITEALYRVSDLFFDGEPLKWSLRKTALEILETVSLSAEISLHEKTRSLERAGALIDGLFSKLELASGGTLISAMNFEVLRREYADLRGHVLDQRKSLDKPILLDNLLSDIISDKKSDLPAGKAGRKELVAANVASETALNTPRSSSTLGVKIPETPSVIPELGRVKEISGLALGAINSRQTTLLSALKQGGPASIGGLTKALSMAGMPVSEKTVQRELCVLVSSGQIKQGGEKRWRRYFI